MSWASKNQFKAGVLASLVASALWIAIGAVSGAHIWTASIPLGVAALLAILAIGVTTSSILLHYSSAKRIAIVVSAFSRKQFFSDLLQHLLLEAALHHWEAVVKIPAVDYSSPHQDGHLAELLREKRSYIGAIVVPIEPQDRRSRLQSFQADFRRPLVFLDVLPFEKSTDFPPDTCFVGFDSLAGGRLAAEAMAHTIRQRGKEDPVILVLASNIQLGRQEGFIARFTEFFPRSQVTVNAECRFLREEAFRAANQYIASRSKTGASLDGIFCTNDEMALGALEAVQAAPHSIRDHVTIIGFDGIQEARVVIDRGKSQLVNTVVQNTSAMVSTAIDRLATLERGETPPLITMLRPVLYRTLD